MQRWIHSVLLPLPVDDCYSYVYEGEAPLPVGAIVHANVNARNLWGVVWYESSNVPVALDKLKPITPIGGVLPKNTCSFVENLANYTLAPKGGVVQLVINNDILKGVMSPFYLYGWDAQEGPRMKKGALPCLPASRQEWQEVGVSAAALTRAAKQGQLKVQGCMVPQKKHAVFAFPCLQLNPDQQKAYEYIKDYTETTQGPILLEGITGSGKTQVYVRYLQDILLQVPAAQVLILVPEIALSSPLAQRLEKLLGFKPALWHTHISKKQRYETWCGVMEGTIPVVVGARSALFLPFRNLRSIVVDEEHDASYKQEDALRYHGRDMALMRGKVEQCPVILASATPSMETLWHVQQKKYGHVVLSSRYGGASLPEVALVSAPKAGAPLSQELAQAISETLAAGEQVLLFLNRRGYAPVITCRHCHKRFMCSHCDAGLVFHASPERMVCHYCGVKKAVPIKCPACGEQDFISLYGRGVEKLAKDIAELFPHARIAVASSDSFKEMAYAQEIVEKMKQGSIDILVGTQLMTKGYHFPHLTCVGVIYGDEGLFQADFRASERVYQLLVQVAGRAGRDAKKGKVWIQTHHPDHPVLQAITQGDEKTLRHYLMNQRQEGGWPPFARLAALVVTGMRQTRVAAYARQLAKYAPKDPSIQVFGPIPAPLARLKDKYRWRLLIKAPRGIDLGRRLRLWLKNHLPPSGVTLVVDRDPETFI